MSEHKTLSAVLRAFDQERTQGQTLAGEFMQLAGTFKDLESFMTACDHAENQRKILVLERHVKEGITGAQSKAEMRLPASWSQTKSNIASMWKMVDAEGNPRSPEQFKSYSELTIELNKARKAGRSGGKGTGKDAVTQNGDDVQALHTFVKGLTHAKRIENAVKSIVALSDGDQSEVLDELETILKDYEPAKVTKKPAKLSDGDIETGLEELEEIQVAIAGSK